MLLKNAQFLAEGIVDSMKPFCEKVRVAGSIRRGKPEVKDIELVAIPKWENRQSADFLFAQSEPVNLPKRP